MDKDTTPFDRFILKAGGALAKGIAGKTLTDTEIGYVTSLLEVERLVSENFAPNLNDAACRLGCSPTMAATIARRSGCKKVPHLGYHIPTLRDSAGGFL